MTVIDELTAISSRCLESGMEIPDFAFLGVTKYGQLLNEMSQVVSGPYNGSGGYVQLQAYLPHGIITIKVDYNVPNEHVSIGRITLTDLIFDDIFLDDDRYAGLGDM